MPVKKKQKPYWKLDNQKKINAMVTLENAQKVYDVVGQGLTSGQGNPHPGKMCVEAAVCFALGLPHGDDPKCVGEDVRSVKIVINDSSWSTNKARGEALREVAVCQLGSNKLDQLKFSKLLALSLMVELLPSIMRKSQILSVVNLSEYFASINKLEAHHLEVFSYLRDGYGSDKGKHKYLQLCEGIIEYGESILWSLKKKKKEKQILVDQYLAEAADLVTKTLRTMKCKGVKLWDELKLNIL